MTVTATAPTFVAHETLEKNKKKYDAARFDYATKYRLHCQEKRNFQPRSTNHPLVSAAEIIFEDNTTSSLHGNLAHCTNSTQRERSSNCVLSFDKLLRA
jgi:hypothetical protein